MGLFFFFCTEEAETEEGTRVDWREAETEEGTRVDQKEAEKQGTKIYTCILHGLQWDKCTCTLELPRYIDISTCHNINAHDITRYNIFLMSTYNINSY